jgi:hypothetical protein
MLKPMVVVLAVALASTASAAGWRSLRVDASSEAAFEQSLAEFKDKLSPARRYVFGKALKDIWLKGSQSATAEQREYTDADYYRQLDGLSYEEVVTLVDPTGETARRYRAAYDPYSAGDRNRYRVSETPSAANSAMQREQFRGQPSGLRYPETRGGTPLFGPSLPQ